MFSFPKHMLKDHFVPSTGLCPRKTVRDSRGGEDHALLEILISERKGRKDQVTKQEASFQKVASVRKMWSSLTEQEVTFARRGSPAGRNRAGTVGESEGCISEESRAIWGQE